MREKHEKKLIKKKLSPLHQPSAQVKKKMSYSVVSINSKKIMEQEVSYLLGS